MNDQISCTALPASNGTQLWLVDLTQDFCEADLSQLAAWERERASRFRFKRDEHRYVVSHLALRQRLSQCLGMAPSSVQIRTTEHGKPFLDGHPIHFNMSHSGDWALIGTHPSQVLGVDIEVEHKVEDLVTLAQHNYTADEFAELQAAGNRQQAFFTCWTRKEACLKALGSGLSVEPVTFDAGINAEPRRVSIPIANGGQCRMSVMSLSIRPGLFGAMALVDDQDANRVF